MAALNDDDIRAGKRFENKLTAGFIAIPLLVFGGWWLAAEQPWVKQKEGGYNCLSGESQRRADLAAQQGVPMLNDPRPGQEWYAQVEQGELVEVSRIEVNFNTNATTTVKPKSYAYSERLTNKSFTARIDGTRFTCTLGESD